MNGCPVWPGLPPSLRLNRPAGCLGYMGGRDTMQGRPGYRSGAANGHDGTGPDPTVVPHPKEGGTLGELAWALLRGRACVRGCMCVQARARGQACVCEGAREGAPPGVTLGGGGGKKFAHRVPKVFSAIWGLHLQGPNLRSKKSPVVPLPHPQTPEPPWLADPLWGRWSWRTRRDKPGLPVEGFGRPGLSPPWKTKGLAEVTKNRTCLGWLSQKGDSIYACVRVRVLLLVLRS